MENSRPLSLLFLGNKRVAHIVQTSFDLRGAAGGEICIFHFPFFFDKRSTRYFHRAYYSPFIPIKILNLRYYLPILFIVQCTRQIGFTFKFRVYAKHPPDSRIRIRRCYGKSVFVKRGYTESRRRSWSRRGKIRQYFRVMIRVLVRSSVSRED